MKVNEGVKHGVYVYRRHLTMRSLSNILGIDLMDINLLVASQILGGRARRSTVHFVVEAPSSRR